MVSAASKEELEKLELNEEERFFNLWESLLNEEQEKERFEDWVRENWDDEYHNFEKFDNGVYEDPDVESTWHGWKEGRNDFFITLERLRLLKYD